MNKLIILIFAIILLSGCEGESVREERQSGGAGFTSICLDEVTYIKYYSNSGYFGLTIKLDKNSKVIPCKNTKIN